MKTIPIACVGSGNTQNAMLREYLRQSIKNTKGLVFIPQELKQRTIEELLAERIEKENAEILETIKQINEEIFGTKNSTQDERQ